MGTGGPSVVPSVVPKRCSPRNNAPRAPMIPKRLRPSRQRVGGLHHYKAKEVPKQVPKES